MSLMLRARGRAAWLQVFLGVRVLGLLCMRQCEWRTDELDLRTVE